MPAWKISNAWKTGFPFKKQKGAHPVSPKPGQTLDTAVVAVSRMKFGSVEFGYLCLIVEYSINKVQNKKFIAIYTHLSLLQILVQRIASISVRRGLNVALIARRSTFSLP